MKTFRESIRKIKVKSPTNRDWSEIYWKNTFEKISNINNDINEDDNNLYLAGLCIGKNLSLQWNAVSEKGLQKYKKEDLLIQFMKFGNAIAGLSIHEKDSLSKFTFDHRATSAGDTLNRMIRYLFLIDESGSDIPPDDLCFELSIIFNSIYILEFIWEKILWEGWSLRLDDDEVCFRPTSDKGKELINHVGIAEFIRQYEYQQIYAIHTGEWIRGLHREFSTPSVIFIGVNNYRPAFDIAFEYPEHMPIYLPSILSYVDDWLRPYLEKPVIQLDKNGLIEVLRTWRIMVEAFHLLHLNGVPPVIHLEDARNLLRKAMPHLTTAAVRKALDFLILEKISNKGDGIWGAPFIKIHGEWLCAFVPSLLFSNVQRMLDLWGDKCIGENLLSFRGVLWEDYVRQFVQNGFTRIYSEEDWWIQKTHLIKWRHEFDLLFRIDSIVFVGELKFSKYPCVPAEFGRFFEDTLPAAAKQALLRKLALEGDRAGVANFTKFNNDPGQLEFYPFVISPYILGSGLKFDGIPCLFFDDIRLYFEVDALHLWPTNSSGEGSVGSLKFRGSGNKPSKDFIRYLEDPPQMFLYKTVANRIRRSYSSHAGPKIDVHWEETLVDLPADLADITSFGKMLERRWLARADTSSSG